MRENISSDGNGVDQKPKRGRPAAPEGERRSENLTLRVRSNVKEALEAHASKNGRSVSAEAEAWLGRALLSEGVLDQAFDLAFGRQLSALMLLTGRLMSDVGTAGAFQATHTLEGTTDWLNNAFAFDQATKAVLTLWDAMRPPGEPLPPKIGKIAGGIDFDALTPQLGAIFANTLCRVVAGEKIGSADLMALGEAARARLGAEVIKRVQNHTKYDEDLDG
jgi:plasmid stability protein